MFDNIAKKIKAVIYVCFAFGCLSSFALALLRLINVVSLRNDIQIEEALGIILVSMLIFAVGSFISWIACFLLYGFAELIERVTHIDEMLSSRAYEWEDEQEDEIEDEQEKAFDFELESILKKQIFLDEEKSDEEEPFHNTVDQ